MKKKPWLKFYGSVPHSIDYPRITLYEGVAETAEKCPDSIAYDFMGYTGLYSGFLQEIDRCADMLAHIGLKKGDRVTISMPTSPQGIICFYALNKLGAVASMIHPLSTESEIEFFVNISNSRFALTLDAFYAKFRKVMNTTKLEKVILARIPDYLNPLMRLGFYVARGRKIPKVPSDPDFYWWKDLMAGNYKRAEKSGMKPDDMAVILYSGGTTGKPKGIMLSNYNFVSHGLMVSAWGKLASDDSILAILPIFHGFGLGVCINACFMSGGKSILVPQFTPDDVAKLIKKKKPTFLIGVPTLYESLNKNPVFQNADLRCLKAAFSGADTLPRVVKDRFENIVKNKGGSVKLLEGYGLTEGVTAICATPIDTYRENSVGIPFPDMDAKIVGINTIDELPIGEEGELCIKGPALMMGYLDNPEETARVLKKHADGDVWLHTGDICTMDEDGFIYFILRQKRMIKSSGMNVYPAQVEAHLYQHSDVDMVCVIGVPDQEQIERVKAFVVLKNKEKAGPEMEQELIKHCRESLIVWSCPREIEFRDELPKTLVGKVAYKVLENEEVEKLRQQGKYTGGR